MKQAVSWMIVFWMAGCALDRASSGEAADMDPGSNGDDSSGEGPGYWECFSANDCPPGEYCSEFHSCVRPPQDDAGPDGAVWVPPEVEVELSSPASGLRYVYVPLPELDGLARIDSESLDVTTVAVGDRPSVLATAPGQDLAVVLNRGSDSATVVRTVEGRDSTATVPTPEHLNRLEMSPSGTVAMAYFEAEGPESSDWGSFQDVAVLRLAAGSDRVQRVTVGFRPRKVVFTEDERLAAIVTDDGVSLLDLTDETADRVAPTVQLSQNLGDEGIPDEVVVSPDGSFAFARWGGLSLVRAVNLASGELIDTTLAGVPTDIDLTADGTRLVAVLRDPSQVVVLEVPGGLGQAGALMVIDCPDLQLGSAILTPDGERALVFTNAINQERLALIDLDTGTIRLVLLRKGVRTALLSPDGATAVVIHNSVPAPPGPSDFETSLDAEEGFSLVNLETLFVKLQVTQGAPGAFAFLPDSTGAYLIVADESVALREVAAIDFEAFTVDALRVGSEPIAVGTVPGTNRVYVVQEHPLGRISFIDVDSQTVRTVTGFQLNSQITE